ncbi:MAG: AMP-binding protein [Akkermansia sp.]|nr:AMP-binding protein [Akkermansia sp.]
MHCPAISIDGCAITPANLPMQRRGGALSPELADFLSEWWGDSPTMALLTSGSTGAPKRMQATRAAMAASAAATCRFFGLKPGDSALLCLPLRYIAGKMMVVRALVGGLNLVTAEPCSTPLAALTQAVDFAPLVPMQVASTLALPDGAEQLARVRTLLLGGGFIDPALAEKLQDAAPRVFASYGMTETLSHIALRAVNGPQRSEWYTPLPGVEISLTPAGTLQISVPWLGIEKLCTHDLAEMAPDGTFRILGRVDAVINSGGVKIQAEEIERELHRLTGLAVLALPLPHPRLGQCVALLWEGPAEAESALCEACANLPRYHKPHFIHRAPLPRTESGKPARALALNLLTHAYEH